MSPTQLESRVAKLREKAGEPDNMKVGRVWNAGVAATDYATHTPAQIRTLTRKEQTHANPTCLPLQLSVAEL